MVSLEQAAEAVAAELRVGIPWYVCVSVELNRRRNTATVTRYLSPWVGIATIGIAWAIIASIVILICYIGPGVIQYIFNEATYTGLSVLIAAVKGWSWININKF